MKSLLVAAGLCVGMSAGAAVETEEVYKQTFEGLSAVPSDWTQANGTISLQTVSENTYLNEQSGGTGSRGAWMTGTSIQSDLATLNATNYTIEFDAVIYEGTNTGNYSQGVYVLGTDLSQSWGAPDKPIARVYKGSNQSTYTISIGGTDIKTDVALTSGTWYHYEFVMSNSNATTDNFMVTIMNQAQTADVATVSGSVDCGTYGLVSGAAIQAGRCKNTSDYSTTKGSTGIDNIIVTTDIDKSAEFVDYKVEYRYNGTLLKSTTANGQVGEKAFLSSAYQEPFWATVSEVSNKYFYVSDNAASVTIENAETVVTVTCRLANNYSYTVNAVDADDTFLKKIATGSAVEGEAKRIDYTQNILLGTTLYTIAMNGANPRFAINITPDKNDYTVNLKYNNGNVSNVVCSVEAEDIEGASAGANDAYASMGKMGYTSGNTTYLEVTDLEIGKYVIYARGVNGNSATRVCNFKVGDEVVYSFDIPNGVNVWGNSSDFSVTETSKLYFACDGSTASGCDWFYIVRTGDATVPVSVASGKEFATFNSDCALDFTSVTGILAYTAKVSADGSEVTFTKVTGAVPANTGLLIRKAGESTSADVPVVATAAAVQNEFIAVTADNCDDSQEYKTVKEGFILATVSGVQGFYKANSTVGTQVAKGKAYLPATGAAARLVMKFGDEEATGISSAKVSQSTEQVYDLQGRHVAQPTKGLYIVNGKKMVIK